MTDWHTRIQRTQHLARGFAAMGRQCVYLNPHLGREFPHPYILSPSPRLTVLESGINELHVHLPFEPVFHHRLLDQNETIRIFDAIQRLIHPYGTRRLTQIVSFPIWIDLAERIRAEWGAPIIYDCHDALAGFRDVPPEVLKAEDKLLASSDLAVFSARRLLDDHLRAQTGLEDKSLLIRNAVEAGWMQRRVPKKNADRVVIGYIGALEFWFDTAAVELAARKHPDWEFRLIGRVEDPGILRLRKIGNVTLTGEVPHDQLHSHLAEFRAAVIPFLRNELTLGTNPIKVYEYFSYGLPVVSKRLPEMEEFGEFVYLCDSEEDFTRALEQAVGEDSPALRDGRVSLASRETWDLRVAQLAAAMDSLDSRVR